MGSYFWIPSSVNIQLFVKNAQASHSITGLSWAKLGKVCNYHPSPYLYLACLNHIRYHITNRDHNTKSTNLYEDDDWPVEDDDWSIDNSIDMGI